MNLYFSKMLVQRRPFAGLCQALALALLLLPTHVLAFDEDLFCNTDAAVFGAAKVVLSGPSRVNGAFADVGSNHLISLSGSSVIEANAASGGEVKLSGSAAVLGSVTQNGPARTLPGVDDLVAAHMTLNHNDTVGLTDAGKVAMDGFKLKLSGGDALTLYDGNYYLEKLVLSGGSTLYLAGDVRIYLDGKADLSGGSLAAEAGPVASLLIIGAGKSKVKLSGASNFHGGVYVPRGKFEVSGDGNAYGGFVAREIKLTGGSEIHGRDVCVQGPPTLPPDILPPGFVPPGGDGTPVEDDLTGD